MLMLTCVDPAVFYVLRDPQHMPAPALHPLVVEVLHELVVLAIDPRGPQGAGV